MTDKSAIRSRLLWCCVDPRGRMMWETLSETRRATVMFGRIDAGGCKTTTDEQFHARGFRVIRVRVVEELDALDEARKKLEDEPSLIGQICVNLEAERQRSDAFEHRAYAAEHKLDAAQEELRLLRSTLNRERTIT